MFSAADLIHALQRRLQLVAPHLRRKPGEFPPGWQTWFDGMAERTQVLQTAELFRARVVDVNPDTVTLEATGTPDKLQALLAVLAPLGIKEMAQSGTVALGRGPRSMSGAGTLRPVERTA